AVTASKKSSMPESNFSLLSSPATFISDLYGIPDQDHRLCGTSRSFRRTIGQDLVDDGGRRRQFIAPVPERRQSFDKRLCLDLLAVDTADGCGAAGDID